MEEENPKVDLSLPNGKNKKPVRLDFPKNDTAKEIFAAIQSARAAKGFGPTFDEKKKGK